MKERLADPKNITRENGNQRKTKIDATTKKNIIGIDIKQSKPIKSKGMKGRNPTALEKRLGNKIGDIGCICCLNKDLYTQICKNKR